MKFCPKVNLDTLVQEKQAGLYAWTGDNWEGTPPSTKYKIKIGMSTSVCNRLYNYHTGHPDGVWILDLLLLKPGVSPKEIRGLETQLKQELKQFFTKHQVERPIGVSGLYRLNYKCLKRLK
jgi:hypothetical protein